MSPLSQHVILVVDDEDNALKVRKMVLEKAGYSVHLASDGSQALTVLEAEHIDVVVSDHLMPGMTGTELAKKIKLDRPFLPVIIFSGVNELPEDVKFADHFVSKTEGPAILLQTIESLLQRQKT